MLAALACAVAAASVAFAGSASNPVDRIVRDTVPPEWGGIWSVHLESHKCSNDSLLFSTTELDTICPNAAFPSPGGGGLVVTCSTTATPTTFSIHCTASSQVLPGCTAAYVVDITGTRNGDTYTATSTTNITYTGACLGIQNSCTRVDQTATRIAPTPVPCSLTPADEETWGELKSVYR